MNGSIVSVNVSAVREREYRGREVTTGIFKAPVPGRIAVRGVNLVGDDQADRVNHGGPDRAVYAYAREDYAWWEDRLSRPIPAGTFGENLTISGIDVGGALIGERWRAGTAVLAVTSPRVPCFKLAMAMDDPAFVREFARAARPGAYLAIVNAGDVAVGDSMEVLTRPSHGLTVAEMFRIFLFERHRLSELLVPELSPAWRDWVLEAIVQS